MLKLFFALGALNAFAAPAALAAAGFATTNPTLSSYTLDRPDTATLHAVSKYYGLEHRRGDSYEVIVPQPQAQFFLSLAPRAQLRVLDASREGREQLRLFGLTGLTNGYRNFDQVRAWMRAHEIARPTLARVIHYGNTEQGRELLALRLNEGSGTKPALIITAATHGDELITTEVMLNLVDRLLAGHGVNDRLTQMIRRHDLYFIPVVNPDGFSSTRRFEGWEDPNRSYPWPDSPSNRPTPSIAALIRLVESVRPAGTLDYHAFGEMVMYPWAYTRNPVDASVKEKFHSITGSMAATNSYAYGPISQVIYVAPGSSADYYFWKTGSLSVAIEIGRQKIPRPEQIPAYVASQEESLWRFIESF